MNEKDIAEVFNVWESQHKLLKPYKKELLSEDFDQVASLNSVGPFYYYIFNLDNFEMELVHDDKNDGLMGVLGIEPKEFNLDKIFTIMHPEDLAIWHEQETVIFNFFLNEISLEDLFLYKTVCMVRLKHSDGTYKTILQQIEVLSASDDGKIKQVLGKHTDVTYLNIPFNHKISFISNKRPSFYSIEVGSLFNIVKNGNHGIFTKREKEIIKKISEGKNFNEIADQLFVSPHTINTHKKNILRKSGCKNTPELIAKCIIDGII